MTFSDKNDNLEQCVKKGLERVNLHGGWTQQHYGVQNVKSSLPHK